MCKGSNFGDFESVKVKIPADISHTGKAREDFKKIDKCLAPLVEMLNKYGIKTTSSCCGHGKEKNAYIGIQGKNLYFGVFDMTGLVSMNLKFPYPEKKK